MSYNNILAETTEHIARITINRPKQLNALNKETIAELSDAFKAADADADVRVIVVTGAGEKAFVAGADIKEFADFSVEQGKALAAEGQSKLFNLVENLSTPVIAAVNGFALGGGLELAMSCHIRIASDNAKLGLPEVSLGVIPGYGGTQRLAHLVGKGKAMEMVMTGGMISAEEGLNLGLVNHVTFPSELHDKVNTIAKAIMKNSPVAIGKAIEAINAGYRDGVNGFDVEIEQFGLAFGTEDFKEGTTAFMEKRKAQFPGR
jgi:enoyl-CoA hydratase